MDDLLKLIDIFILSNVYKFNIKDSMNWLRSSAIFSIDFLGV